VRFTVTKSMGDEANLGDEIHGDLETDEVDSNSDKALREGERKIRVGALLKLTNYVWSPPTKKFSSVSYRQCHKIRVSYRQKHLEQYLLDQTTNENCPTFKFFIFSVFAEGSSLDCS
jgi:hypothetical protein